MHILEAVLVGIALLGSLFGTSNRGKTKTAEVAPAVQMAPAIPPASTSSDDYTPLEPRHLDGNPHVK